MTTLRTHSLLVLALMTLCACGGVADLRATGPQWIDDGRDAAMATHDDGVRLTVIAGSWTFRPQRVASATLPLEFVIENRSEFAWHVRRDDIRLIDDRGVEHAPLAPQAIDVGARDLDTVRVVALPEETIRARETTSGFVYFEPLPPDVDAVRVQWLPRRAFGQDRLDTLEITFDVVR